MLKVEDFIMAEEEDMPGMISKKWDITDHDNYWHKVGTAPFALVAHIDTVPIPFKDLFYNRHLKILHNLFGPLGADDRAGCYIVYKLLERFDPHVFLFNYEEMGGMGVNTYTHDLKKGMDPDIEFFLEFDRQGLNEYVYYSFQEPKQLTKWASRAGLMEAWGSYSDVSTLTSHTGIPHLNLSAAFINEHSDSEILHIPALKALIEVYTNMLTKAPTNVPKLKKQAQGRKKWGIPFGWGHGSTLNTDVLPYSNMTGIGDGIAEEGDCYLDDELDHHSMAWYDKHKNLK